MLLSTRGKLVLEAKKGLQSHVQAFSKHLSSQMITSVPLKHSARHAQAEFNMQVLAYLLYNAKKTALIEHFCCVTPENFSLAEIEDGIEVIVIDCPHTVRV